MSRRECWLWLLTFVAGSLFASVVDFSSTAALAGSMGAVNYFLVFALFIAFHCVWESDAGLRASRFDLAVVGGFAIAMLLLSLMRNAMGIGLSLSLAASRRLFDERRRDKAHQSNQLNSAGRILFVIALSIFWCKLAIMALGPMLVVLDSVGVSLFVSVFWPEVSQKGPLLTNPAGHSILIGGGCSVFTSVSPGLMFAASAFLAQKPWISRTEWLSLAGLFLALLTINAVRLAWLATSYERYVYWHDGDGVQILSLIQTGAVILFTALPFLLRRRAVAATA